MSRFKVARLLDAAREMGLVRIEIVRRGSLDLDASAQLQERYGLRHALVVEVPDRDGAALRQLLGEAAAHLLQEVVTPDDVLGLPWSRSVHAVVGALTHLPAIEVVQLSGAIALPDFDSSSVDIVRRASRLAGGTSHVFYAPFVLDDAASAEALRRQPAVAEGLDRAALGDRGCGRYSGSGRRGSRPSTTCSARGNARTSGGRAWWASWRGSSSTARDGYAARRRPHA